MKETVYMKITNGKIIIGKNTYSIIISKAIRKLTNDEIDKIINNIAISNSWKKAVNYYSDANVSVKENYILISKENEYALRQNFYKYSNLQSVVQQRRYLVYYA